MENQQNENNLHRREKAVEKKRKPIKIKYISSPIMCEASNASEFRAIVQQHTGQDDHRHDHQYYHNRDVVTAITTTATTTTKTTANREAAMSIKGFDEDDRRDYLRNYYDDHNDQFRSSTSMHVPESYGSWFSGDLQVFSESFPGFLNNNSDD